MLTIADKGCVGLLRFWRFTVFFNVLHLMLHYMNVFTTLSIWFKWWKRTFGQRVPARPLCTPQRVGRWADGLDGRSSVTQIGLFSLTWQLSKSKSYNRANFQFSAIKVNIYFAESRNWINGKQLEEFGQRYFLKNKEKHNLSIWYIIFIAIVDSIFSYVTWICAVM